MSQSGSKTVQRSKFKGPGKPAARPADLQDPRAYTGLEGVQLLALVNPVNVDLAKNGQSDFRHF